MSCMLYGRSKRDLIIDSTSRFQFWWFGQEMCVGDDVDLNPTDPSCTAGSLHWSLTLAWWHCRSWTTTTLGGAADDFAQRHLWGKSTQLTQLMIFVNLSLKSWWLLIQCSVQWQGSCKQVKRYNCKIGEKTEVVFFLKHSPSPKESHLDTTAPFHPPRPTLVFQASFLAPSLRRASSFVKLSSSVLGVNGMASTVFTNSTRRSWRQTQCSPDEKDPTLIVSNALFWTH